MSLKKHLFKLVLCLAILLKVQIGFAQISEANLKAVWIENFTRFIQWPQHSNQDTFKIKVLGKGPMNRVLKDVYGGRTIQGKKVQVIEIKTIEEASNCHILFINEDWSGEIHNIIDFLDGQPILTIADTDGFANKGIIINFFLEDNKVRFEFNLTSFKSTNMDVNFRLLEVAKVIKRS